MKAEQKVVAVGAASGIVVMALSVWLLTGALPTPSTVDALGERLGYALRADNLDHERNSPTSTVIAPGLAARQHLI
jgi:hypothetical protein